MFCFCIHMVSHQRILLVQDKDTKLWEIELYSDLVVGKWSDAKRLSDIYGQLKGIGKSGEREGDIIYILFSFEDVDYIFSSLAETFDFSKKEDEDDYPF